MFYVSAKKTLDSLAEFLWEPLEEPKMCYCPKREKVRNDQRELLPFLSALRQ